MARAPHVLVRLITSTLTSNNPPVTIAQRHGTVTHGRNIWIGTMTVISRHHLLDADVDVGAVSQSWRQAAASLAALEELKDLLLVHSSTQARSVPAAEQVVPSSGFA